MGKCSGENTKLSTPANGGKVRVKKTDGTIVTYNGTNARSLVGFWMVENAKTGFLLLMAPTWLLLDNPR
jgi:hypothetical protein